MPLLLAEPYLYPEHLFESAADADAGWWVIHTRPRAEKAFARQMAAARVGYFLPLYQKRWVSNGRRQTSHLPLFPGYAFLRGDAAARLLAFETNLVANCLPVPDQDRLTAELAGIHRLMASDVPLTPEQKLVPGTRVRMTDGPFAGLSGTLAREGTRARFVVEVHLINQGVSVEMDRWMFEPVAENGRGGERLRAALIRG